MSPALSSALASNGPQNNVLHINIIQKAPNWQTFTSRERCRLGLSNSTYVTLDSRNRHVCFFGELRDEVSAPAVQDFNQLRVWPLQ